MFLNVKQMLFKKFDKGIEDGKFYFYWFKLYMIICIIFFYKNKEIKNWKLLLKLRQNKFFKFYFYY